MTLKPLNISDLDGMLLNSYKEINEFEIGHQNEKMTISL
ncbi:MAG: hypothetical protein K0R69_3316 [Clostridia bacterium]|nr:hypothetical protein [Clostridia bacterium]